MEKVPDGFLLESRAISMMDLGHMFLKSDHVVGKKVARQLELPAQVFTVRIVPPSIEEATKCGKSISFSCPQARCPEDFILPGQGAEGGVKAALLCTLAELMASSWASDLSKSVVHQSPSCYSGLWCEPRSHSREYFCQVEGTVPRGKIVPGTGPAT